ncbi:MAG: glycosyltransferase [Candidatus Andeanibacterium colombiense]|uniref:Glycosyltransferase n=1 Tax=Candidatus Andeanibacterium colombiense TaxID=3121345 RepID=A0AAJ6BPJ3_9SPHN|nr:MAG: glycosyltransferase [Sphingomonadaceae bacterium]
MRRVLSLATLYPNAVAPRFGTFVARQMEALAERRNWDVTVINPVGIPPVVFGRYRKLAGALASGDEHGVHVRRPRFTLIPGFARRNPAAIARAVLPLARRLHAQQPFDLVDAQFFYPDGPAAASIASALGLPLSIKARGADIHLWGRKDWARAAMVAAGTQAAGLLAVSGPLADDMAAMGLPRHKIAVHYTGLDRTRFHPLGRDNARLALAADFGLRVAPERVLIACVGALIERKGQAFAIRALAQLPEAELALVGAGPDRQSLQRLADELGVNARVHFLGTIDHDQLPIVLSAAAAMVLPSASEGLANAWVEALACGTPLVICDAGGAREVVRNPSAGRIVARDAGAIAAALTELLADPVPPQFVAANAARYSWEANAAALEQYYDRLVG